MAAGRDCSKLVGRGPDEMSTTYYLLKEPVTSLSFKEGGGHARLWIWVEHGLAGELVVPRGVGREVAMLFADEDKPVLRTSWDGPSVGIQVVLLRTRVVPRDTTVVSEAGEVTTFGEVMAREGQGR